MTPILLFVVLLLSKADLSLTEELCGGTVVDATHVVTAAHCLCKYDPKNKCAKSSKFVGKEIAVGNTIPAWLGEDSPRKQVGVVMNQKKGT